MCRLGATSVCALCVHMYVSAYLCARLCVCVSVCVREQTIGGWPGRGGGRCLQAFGEPERKPQQLSLSSGWKVWGQREACGRAGPGTDLKNCPPHQHGFPPHPRAGQVPLTTPALPAPPPSPRLAQVWEVDSAVVLRLGSKWKLRALRRYKGCPCDPEGQREGPPS